MSDLSTIYQRPVELLQHLLRFDTTNPPGNETPCVQYLHDVLAAAGIESTLLGKDPDRLNLVARLPGRGEAPPLLLQGHVDVVTTQGQTWQHPPFAGEVADGYVWGRGAIDMKDGVAMLVAAFVRAKVEQLPLAGDVVLAIVGDEEVGGVFGARYLVENHAHQFEGIRYGIGEFGGFTVYVGGRKFYLIQVAEKTSCRTRLTFRGPGGHGSMPLRGGAMAKLGRVLQRLDASRPPVHVTPATRMLIEAMADALPEPMSEKVRALGDDDRIDAALAELGPLARLLGPILRNTASPTIVRGGDKINVIPAEITLELDGRLLPGQKPADLIRELSAAVGDDAEIEVLHYDPIPNDGNLDLAMLPLLSDIVRRADPEGIPAPFLMSGGTDGRIFARLGIQPYGFLPVNLPSDFNFLQTVHAADERLPVEAMDFGVNAVYDVLRRFGEVHS
jgi:acetylornithine deacetylase/succinyl-diaminopimelate desuccinylase-like protein